MKVIKKYYKGKKFSNTPTGRAMQRQYDKENGIAYQRVLPEVEVFPNYYDVDNNSYGNSFAIPLESRPAVFSQGEISQPYVPERLVEQGWLNRLLGIRGLDLGILNFIINPVNVVPSRQLIQGVEALSSMGRTPIKLENAIVSRVQPKVIISNPSASRLSPYNTLSELDFIEYMSNAEFRDAYNRFASKYGYEEMPIGLTRQQMNEMAQRVIERHNSFFRGVEPITSQSKLAQVTAALGHTPSVEEQMLYSATHSYPGYKGVWASPVDNAGIYGGRGKVALIRRPYKLGPDRRNWFNEGDFKVGLAQGPTERVIDPWGNGFENSVPNELLIDHPEFVRWLGKGEIDEPITSLNTAAKSNNVRYSNGMWYAEDANGRFLEVIPEKLPITPSTMFTASKADWAEAMRRAIAANNEVEVERLNFLYNYIKSKPELQEIYAKTAQIRNQILDKVRNKTISWFDTAARKAGIDKNTSIEDAERLLDLYLNKIVNSKGEQLFLQDFNAGKLNYNF